MPQLPGHVGSWPSDPVFVRWHSPGYKYKKIYQHEALDRARKSRRFNAPLALIDEQDIGCKIEYQHPGRVSLEVLQEAQLIETVQEDIEQHERPNEPVGRRPEIALYQLPKAADRSLPQEQRQGRHNQYARIKTDQAPVHMREKGVADPQQEPADHKKTEHFPLRRPWPWQAPDRAHRSGS